MPYLIDGHNLIPRVPGLDLAQVDDELALVALLRAFCGRARTRVEVFFDNAPPGHAGWRQYGAVRARFVRQGRSADAAIRTRLARLGREARNWQVVSSDREVQAAARAAGARVTESADFAQRLSQARAQEPAEREPELGPEELQAWLDLFGEENDPGTGTS